MGNLEDKLRILADAAKYDASCASSGSHRARKAGGIGHTNGEGICHSFTPDGRCVSLLKILLTNYCVFDCSYCVNRISSDTPRARFTVDEVVNLTLDFYKRNYIEGLFLSSGIIQSPDYTMEQLVAVARKLRLDHMYGGYIHLKGAAGASRELLTEAGRWADRISVNIEFANQSELDRLAPAKQHASIESAMTHIHNVKQEDKRIALAGQTTQMVIGATPGTDAEILAKSAQLYKAHRLRRVYFSAFSPIPHASADLPVKPAPLVREHRLYQADWLMRFYGFHAGELTAQNEPNLPLGSDPKLAWALRHREFFPVDVNAAAREVLLRVPGFGVRNVKRVLGIRRFHRLRLADLAKLKIPIKRALNFIVTDDSTAPELDTVHLPRLFAGKAEQLSLFEAPVQARSGEF